MAPNPVQRRYNARMPGRRRAEGTSVVRLEARCSRHLRPVCLSASLHFSLNDFSCLSRQAFTLPLPTAADVARREGGEHPSGLRLHLASCGALGAFSLREDSGNKAPVRRKFTERPIPNVRRVFASSGTSAPARARSTGFGGGGMIERRRRAGSLWLEAISTLRGGTRPSTCSDRHAADGSGVRSSAS